MADASKKNIKKRGASGVVVATPIAPAPMAPRNPCRVESMVTVDERGQMVLPKDIREKAGIMPGDKLVLVTWEKNGGVCCISLMKSDELMGMVSQTLRPMAEDLSII